MRATLYLLIVLVTVLAGINVFFVSRSSQSQGQFALSPLEPVFNTTYAYILPVSEPSYIPILDANVPEPTVDARSGALYDLRSGRFLFTKNTRDRVPVASLTKVLTAVVVLEQLHPDDVVVVGKESVRADGTKQDLYVGEYISVRNLLKLMLITSSNDAAYALAAHAREKGIDLVAAMNAKAVALDMTDSRFLDPAGLDDQAYSTAQDLVKLVRYALRYDMIWDISAEQNASVASEDGAIKHELKSTDQLLGVIPDIIGGKTGYTDGAGGCLILIVNVPGQNDKLVSVVLGSKDRFADTQKLIEWAKTAYRWH